MPDLPRGWATFGHSGPSLLLLNTFRAGRLAHAYLITGPKQSGRRTLALDLARAVNCRPAPDLFGAAPDKPCGECPQCVRITRGIHADVRIINVDTPTEKKRGGDDEEEGGRSRKTMISIEHVRDMERDAWLKPFEGNSRAFIIDGAELLHPAAANALLKTLEEPPPEVIIILVAADKGALLPTIISRCQQIELRPVATETIERELTVRHKTEPEQARTLARLARGRPGWAISALSDPTALDRQAQAIQRIMAALAGDLESRFNYARQLSDSFWRKRDDVLLELDFWLDWWRDIALVRNGLERFVTYVDWLPTLAALGRQLDGDAIARGVETVTGTRNALVANANSRLALDVMMLDLPFIAPSKLPAASISPAAGRPDRPAITVQE